MAYTKKVSRARAPQRKAAGSRQQGGPGLAPPPLQFKEEAPKEPDGFLNDWASSAYSQMLKELEGQLQVLIDKMNQASRNQEEAGTNSQEEVNKVLQVALAKEKQLKKKYGDKYGHKDKFNGYGRGKDKFVCTTFAFWVLKKAGFSVNPTLRKQVNININWKEELGKEEFTPKEKNDKLKELVMNDDPRTKGVVHALVQSGQGTEIDVQNAQEGDFVQYWYMSKGNIAGHVVIVKKVLTPPKGGKRLKVHGSHGATKGLGTIGLWILNKNGKQPNFLKKIYAVRPKTS